MSDTTTSQQSVYFFGEGRADGGSDLKHLVGGKGASLAEMTQAQAQRAARLHHLRRMLRALLPA